MVAFERDEAVGSVRLVHLHKNTKHQGSVEVPCPSVSAFISCIRVYSITIAEYIRDAGKKDMWLEERGSRTGALEKAGEGRRR